MKRTLLLLLLCIPILSFGGNCDSTLVGRTASHALHTSGAWVTSPLKWNKCDWALFGVGSAVTVASVFYADEPIRNFVLDHHDEQVNNVLSIMDPVCDYSGLIAMGAFASYGFIAKDNYALETALIVIEGYALNALLAQTVKRVMSRARPYGEADPLNWTFFSNEHNSFFSGHTSSAFTVASILSWRYRDSKWVPWVSYGLATLGGVQRIYDNRHWTSDVIFGALAGTATGLFVSKYNENKPFQVYPVVAPDVAGLTVIFPINQ